MKCHKQNHRVSGARVSALLLLGAIAMCWSAVGRADTNSDNAVERIQVAPPGPNNPRNSEGDLIRLKDGRLFIVYGHFTGSSGDHDTADLAGRFSTDGGKTWTDPAVTVVRNAAAKNTISVSLLRLQNGHIAMFYLRTNSKVDCRPWMQISTDECKSWSEPRVCIDEVAYFILNNDRAVQLQSGRIVLPVVNHNRPEWKQRDRNGVTMCYLSDDDGRTWRRSKDTRKAYTPQGKRCLVQEPGVVELGDGRLMMFCRTEMGSQYVSFSSDGGDTWSAFGPSNITSPLSPASIKRIPQTGDLLLVWNNIKHDPGFAMKRTRLNTAISRDDGRTWEKTKTIEEDSRYGYCYTAIEFVGDDVVLAYSRWRYKGDTLGIQVALVPLEWIYFATEEKPPCYPDHSRLFVYLDESGKEHPVKTASHWEIRRGHILEAMQSVMGPLPKREQLPALDYKTTARLEEKDFVRLTISLLVEENDRVSAFLYLPKGRPEKQRVAAVLALHPTSRLGKRSVAGENPKPNRSYALELAQRGYVVIAPDYPPYGDYKGYDFDSDKYVSGTMKGIVNHMRCVDLLQSLDEVDPQRIGVIGHSLGGHNAIFVGAFDDRIKAVVSSCGWTSFADDDIPSWAGPSYMPLIRDKYRSDPKRIPFDFCEIIATLAPRAFFSNSPLHDDDFSAAGVKKSLKHVLPVYELLGAENKPCAIYPDSPHDFVPRARRLAYEFIDRTLGHKPLREIP